MIEIPGLAATLNSYVHMIFIGKGMEKVILLYLKVFVRPRAWMENWNKKQGLGFVGFFLLTECICKIGEGQ